MNISKHITLEVASYSETAIRKGLDNTPDESGIERMKILAEACLEPLFEQFPGLHLNSFFRSVAVNSAVGGSTTSQHCKCEAADVSAPKGATYTNKDIHGWAKANLKFDQLIDEFPDKNGIPAWVHISFTKVGTNRNQSLKAISQNGKTVYVNL